MNNKPPANWALGILQIITLAVIGWILTNMVDMKERLVRIEYQIMIRKAEVNKKQEAIWTRLILK